MKDLTARCLAWRGLLEWGQGELERRVCMLERAGIVRREKNSFALARCGIALMLASYA
ncbi:MAG: hypothetical protein AB7D27_12225 [Desulfomicrobium sp.]